MLRLPYPVILASGSPRRKVLLGQIVEEFEVVVPDLDESALVQSDPWGTAESLALAKASLVAKANRNRIVIGGDTVVAIALNDGETEYRQLGKPGDEDEAHRMLRALSGKRHAVITGVAIRTPHGTDVFSETSRVVFRDLDDDEIRAYISTGEPMDKAGAYAIQGGAAAFVAEVEGSMSNIVGLPLEALEERLERYLAMACPEELPKTAQPAPDSRLPAENKDRKQADPPYDTMS